MKFLSDILARAGLTVDGVVTFNNTATGQTPATNDNSTKLATTAFIKNQSYLTANQTITVSGDATGSGTTSIALTLANSGVTAGTYGNASNIPTIVVDSKGRITSISTNAVSIITTLAGLSDVTLTSPSANQVLQYNGTRWVNGAAPTTYTLPIATASVLGGIKVGDGLSIDAVTGVLSASAGGGGLNFRTIQEFTATAGQTTFTITGGYTPGYIEVLINGVYVSESEYTASNGTTVALDNAVAHNDIVTVFLYSLYNLGSSNYARNISTLTATAGQTVFNVSYIPGQIDIFYNGSKLTSAEFTATNGTTVTLVQAAVLGDILEVVTYLAGAGVNASRTLTINGVTYDLSADRSWTIPTGTSGSGTTNYLSKWTGSTSLGNSLIFDNGSGIGINTASPFESSAFKLDVNGGVIIKNTSGIAAQLILIDSNPATGGNNGFVQLSAGGNTATAFGQWQTYYGTSIASGTLRLQPAGGVVLVGSSTAVTGAGLLQVAGDVNITGTFRINGTAIALGTTLNGTGLVRMSGTTVSYDNATYATQSYVTTAISNLVNAAPATLDTLNELAAALGNDAAFSTTVTNSIASKQAQLNGTGFVKISGTTISYDNSTYLTTSSASSTYLPLTGGTVTGVLNVNSALRIKSGSPNGILLETYSTNELRIRVTPVSTTFDMNLVFPSSSRTYTYPNATGTIALTSDIPTVAGVYLPLTGGTLTDALTIKASSFGGVLYLQSGTTIDNWLLYHYSPDNTLRFNYNGAGGDEFIMASNGAATFSSTLRVGGATGNFLIDSYTTSKIGIRSWTDTAGTTNNFFVQNSANFNYGILGVVSATGTSIGDVYGLGYSPSAGTSMTPVLSWTSNGNVGIQNNDPQARLHIGAALSNSADITNGLILKQTSTNETTGIYLERSGERKGYAIYVGGSLDSLVFQRNNGGTKSDVLTLTRDGHVGINQQNPTGLGGPTFVVAGSGYPEVIVEKTGTNARKWGFTVGSDGSYLLRDYTSGANVFTVNTSGGANFSNNVTVGGNTVWTSANDGSGSGLDADLLDGRDSGGYMTQVQGGIEFLQGSYTGWYKLARSSQATNGAGGRGAFKIIVAQTGNYLVPSQDEIKGFKDWGTTLSITSIESTKESIFQNYRLTYDADYTYLEGYVSYYFGGSQSIVINSYVNGLNGLTWSPYTGTVQASSTSSGALSIGKVNNGLTVPYLRSAGGIQFGNGTSTLNYYEEGTFTPTVSSSTYNSVSVTFGRYVRIGNQVTINCKWEVTVGSTGRKYFVFNLPFAFNISNGVSYTGAVSNYDSGISANSSNVGTTVRNSSGSDTQQYVEAVFTNTNAASIHFSMTYFTF